MNVRRLFVLSFLSLTVFAAPFLQSESAFGQPPTSGTPCEQPADDPGSPPQGPATAITPTCEATATTTTDGPGDHAYDPDGPSDAGNQQGGAGGPNGPIGPGGNSSGGHHWLGTKTGSGFTTTGMYAGLNVADADLVHEPNGEYLSQRLLATSCNLTNYIEVGWTEVGWRPDQQYVYTYSTRDHAYHFYDQYPLVPGQRIYVELYKEWYNTPQDWEALLWWNGGWQVLDRFPLSQPGSPTVSLDCGENLVEVQAQGDQHFPFPQIEIGDGGSGGVQIETNPQGTFHTWDTTIPTTSYTTANSGYYTLGWSTGQQYFGGRVTSHNDPPQVQMNVSPPAGSVTTTFNANLSGSDPDGDPLTYSIDWGDGSSTPSASGSHQYATPGDYEVTGRAEDPRGDAASTSAAIRVCAASSGSTCVAAPSTDQDVCLTIAVACSQTSGASSLLLSSDPCDLASAQCNTATAVVSSTEDQVLDKVPDTPVTLPDRGVSTFTVVTVNALQAYYDGPSDCPDPGDDGYDDNYKTNKDCNEAGRERTLAKRIRVLAFKSEDTDAMRGSIPDIILLQEIRGDDLSRPDGSGIVPYLNQKFPNADWKIAGHPSQGNATSDHGDHRTQHDTAIIYANANVKWRKDVDATLDQDYIQTRYLPGEKCDPDILGVSPDSDQDLFQDCDKPTWKEHQVASFQRRGSSQTLGVVSAHLVPPDYLDNDTNLRVAFDETRADIYRRWAEHLANRIQSKGFFPASGDRAVDAWVIGGDLNAHKCPQGNTGEPEKVNCGAQVNSPWWSALKGDFFYDSVFKLHGDSQQEMNRQYDDGNSDRKQRVDYIWVKRASEFGRASHDVTCGNSDGRNCDILNHPERYSDHRLVFSIFKL